MMGPAFYFSRGLSLEWVNTTFGTSHILRHAEPATRHRTSPINDDTHHHPPPPIPQSRLALAVLDRLSAAARAAALHRRHLAHRVLLAFMRNASDAWTARWGPTGEGVPMGGVTEPLCGAAGREEVARIWAGRIRRWCGVLLHAGSPGLSTKNPSWRMCCLCRRADAEDFASRRRLWACFSGWRKAAEEQVRSKSWTADATSIWHAHSVSPPPPIGSYSHRVLRRVPVGLQCSAALSAFLVNHSLPSFMDGYHPAGQQPAAVGAAGAARGGAGAGPPPRRARAGGVAAAGRGGRGAARAAAGPQSEVGQGAGMAAGGA